jgi:translocation and assembly module TamA
MLRYRRQAIDFRKKILLASATAAIAFAMPAHAADSYSAVIEGAPNGLKSKLELISELVKGQRAYPTGAALRRAARRDVEAFKEALTAAGYYAGKADFDLIRSEDGAQSRVVFQITPGPAFTVVDYAVLYQDAAEGRPVTLADAGIKTNGKADGASLRNHQDAFLSYLWNNGYPSAEIINRRAIADFETNEAQAVFVFRSGPKARFGKPEIKGVDKTDPSFIARMKTWEEGEEFERAKLTTYYERIVETGLFSKIEVAPGDVGDDGAAPIIVELEERKARTIGAGVSFSTSEGPGGRLFFEHRNIFGRGENLGVEMRGSQIEQSLNAVISRPMPRFGGRVFASAKFANETTDAFNARSLELSGGLSKKWLNDNLETRGALALETANVRNTGVEVQTIEERTYLVSTPLSVIWNSEDDLLDPKKGFRASFSVTPYTGTDTFTQSELSGRSRIHVGANDVVTFAARAALGATLASEFENIPLNKRYYAGGGGSVRGYGYQEAGPLNADNDPIGGRSRIEGALEARVKVIKNLQLAAFIDAGSVSEKAIPDFNDEFFIGYGGGVRYMTPIGPIRADIAFPLDKRETDAGFQIYIALGQPF